MTPMTDIDFTQLRELLTPNGEAPPASGYIGALIKRGTRPVTTRWWPSGTEAGGLLATCSEHYADSVVLIAAGAPDDRVAAWLAVVATADIKVLAVVRIPYPLPASALPKPKPTHIEKSGPSHQEKQ